MASAGYTISYPRVATPTLDPAPTTYNTDQDVTISCGTVGATIYYTTDGVTTPTTGEIEYNGAIPWQAMAPP